MTTSTHSIGRAGRLAATGLLAASLALTGCSGGGTTVPASASTAASTRVVHDEIGDVTVKTESTRIATTAPAYTTSVLLLGGADKLVALEENYGKNEWIKEKYPQLADLPVVFSSNQTNMEELIDQKPDLVIYASRYGTDTLAQLQDLGIAAVSSRAGSKDSGYDHLDLVRDNQAYLGEVIGGEQATRAGNYADEFDAIRSSIQERASGLADDQRPTVVQVSETSGSLEVNNGSAIGQELITLAGGVNAAADASGESAGPSGQTKIDPEQLIAWNPQILIVDSQAMADDLRGDSTYASLRAVQGNRIYVVPNGAMAWAYNGPEEYLAMQFFAKAIHPELFEDVDLAQATKDFYGSYFGFEVSDQDLAYLFKLSDGQTVADVFTR
ncbi:ABC transporter substrate-binding protein [uncultured Propionibacterium sp.]|uniref:ABC transporter substrate-binding protein n=1 Tax=uncultured Propionibacterium sp. TaxID=218066 RepID=UPI002930BF43|nr:ABC transporter substrate-binding protein [uncultured Propionibacterium sp.]